MRQFTAFSCHSSRGLRPPLQASAFGPTPGRTHLHFLPRRKLFPLAGRLKQKSPWRLLLEFQASSAFSLEAAGRSEQGCLKGGRQDGGEATPLIEALLAVIDAARAYLPPDGIGKDEFIARVLEATDNPRIIAAALAAHGHPVQRGEEAVPCRRLT